MGHWYTKTGEPRYDAGMREARKDKLLPSVTTIENVIASPGLENYRAKQLLMSAQTLTRGPDETDDEYVRRVKADADTHRRQAAKLGTVVHHLIERYLSGRELFYHGSREDVWQIFEPVKWWINGVVDEVLGTEVVLYTDRYAGKADAIVVIDNKTYIIDWKTTDPAGKLKKDGTPGKGKIAFPSHCRQLSALAFCDNVSYDGVMNVYISTNPDIPGVWAHEWSREDVMKGGAEFLCATDLWYLMNRYEL